MSHEDALLIVAAINAVAWSVRAVALVLVCGIFVRVRTRSKP